jgi:hypothetical protein
MLVQLGDLDEVWLHALNHLLAHKRKVKKAYNKHIWLKNLSIDDLVGKTIIPIGHKDPKFHR